MVSGYLDVLVNYSQSSIDTLIRKHTVNNYSMPYYTDLNWYFDQIASVFRNGCVHIRWTKVCGHVAIASMCNIFFVAKTASALLGGLPSWYWSVSMGICAHSVKRALVRSGTGVGREGLACCRHSSTSQRCCHVLMTRFCADHWRTSAPLHQTVPLLTQLCIQIRPSDWQIGKGDSSLQRICFYFLCAAARWRTGRGGEN